MAPFRPRTLAVALAPFFLLAAPLPLPASPITTIKPVESRRRVVAAAESYRGVPYLLGGTDRKGLDCSGFVALSYRDAMGVDIPRTVRELHALVESVERADLQSGDLVFFDTTGPLSHVGIYVGKGRFLHAASAGPKKAVIVSLLDDESWARDYAGAGRLVAPARFLGLLSISN